MQVFGQLGSASLENLSADPTTVVQGRIYLNTAKTQAILDDGTNKRALLRNDQFCVFGTDSTASNNVRLHHAGVGTMQVVIGNDTTAENTLSTNLAQFGHRAVNVSAVPATGNLGRIVYNTATAGVMAETSAGFLQFATLTGSETLTNKTLTGPKLDINTFTDQTATPATPASGSTKFYTKSGLPYKLGSDGIETLLASAVSYTATYGVTSALPITANAVVKYPTKVKDTTGSLYSTSTGFFTAPVTGTYQISLVGNTSSGASAYVKVNGTSVGYLTTTSANGNTSGFICVQASANQTIGIYFDISVTLNASATNGFVNQISIQYAGA